MNFKIDLKNIDLKNISLEDIQAKLKNVEKKTWIKIGSIVGAVVLFLIIFYGVLNPIVEKKKVQLDDMNLKMKETEEMKEITGTRGRLLDEIKGKILKEWSVSVCYLSMTPSPKEMTTSLFVAN